MDLEALITLARSVDEASFVEAHPAPGLVVWPRQNDTPCDTDPEVFDAHAGHRSPTKTSIVRVGRDFRIRRSRRSSQVAFEPVAKSGRNAYVGMITVGRAPNNDICLAVASVSKLHAFFQREGPRFVLRDSMSSFGTFVGGAQLSPDFAVPVEEGSQIMFGPDASCTFFSAAGLHAFLRTLHLSSG